MKRLPFLSLSLAALPAAFAGAPLSVWMAGDRPEGVYVCGETAELSAVFQTADGAKPKAGTVRWTLDDFGTNRLASGTVDLAKTDRLTVRGALATPGFLRLACDSADFGSGPSGSGRRWWCVAFSPEKIRSPRACPADFDAFWADGLARLDREVPLDAQCAKDERKSAADAALDWYQVSFATFGRRVYGSLSVPKDASAAKTYPLRVTVPGASYGAWSLAPCGAPGVVTLDLSVYPWPLRDDWKDHKAERDAFDRACREKWGTDCYRAGSAGKREDNFYYPVILGGRRAVAWAAARPYVDRDDVSYSGSSQGGAMGYALMALAPEIRRGALLVPAMSCHAMHLVGRADGWPQYATALPSEAVARALGNAPYYDGVNFAARIRQPVFFSAGFVDPVCPPHGVYAAYNACPSAEKTVYNGLGEGHSVGAAMGAAYEAFLRRTRRRGTPAATVREEKVSLVTYSYSDPDPVPATAKPRYPYTFFDGATTNGAPKDWNAVILENDRIRVTVLPEIGGKVWGAVDKATGHAFIYFNHAAKFRNIAMRGPWCSGGIEFNFGIIGHSPSTVAPVSYLCRTNGDGSVSCFVSDTELICGTTWQVEIRLRPGEDRFTTHVTWYNGSNQVAPYYQWSTAAFPARGDPDLVFPGTNYIGHSGLSHAWPIDPEGHNLAKYSGNAFGGAKSEHVLNGDNSLFGLWWPGKGVGASHRNHAMDKYGRKVFLWSLARDGGMWEDLLTDTDGQYVELQSGRCFNQPCDTYGTPFKHPGFAPGATHLFTEEWGVVRNRGEFVCAEDPSRYVARPQRMPTNFNWSAAWGRYVKGEQMLRQRFDRDGESELLAALAAEPHLAPALDELAALAVRRGECAKAHAYAARALALDTYDPAANFADGCAFFAEGDTRRAKERLGLAAYAPDYAAAAFALAARAELRDRRLRDAETLADRALASNRLNADALLVRIVAARLRGDAAGARARADAALAALPLFHAARYEQALAGGAEPIERYVRCEFPGEVYLALGDWYGAAGLADDARGFYRRAAETTALGDILAGELAAAKARPIAFTLPHRAASIPPLLDAVRRDGHWKFRYYAAVALAANGRDAEADAQLDACANAPDDAIFYLYRASRRTGTAALSDLRRAQRLSGAWRVGAALGAHFADLGDWEKAIDELRPVLARHPDVHPLKTAFAKALCNAGRARECVDFLRGASILPAEFGGDASDAWIVSWGKLADEALIRGDVKAARAAVAEAISYPENLGRGKPYKLHLKGTAEHPTAFERWTPAVRALVDENGLKPEDQTEMRPYEIVLAGRDRDFTEPWIDFETETGWFAETTNGVARARRSRARQIFGAWTLELAMNAMEARLRPREPLEVPERDFNLFGAWMRGPKTRYDVRRDDTLPYVDVVFTDGAGRRECVPVTDKFLYGGYLNWSEWHYVARKFTAEELARIRAPGMKFDGFRFRGCTNATEQLVYLDNIAFVNERLKGETLGYGPRPKRNLTPLANGLVGLNTGADTLPFPTREETSSPESSAPGATTDAVTNGAVVVLTYAGADGRLAYRWDRARPGLDGLTASWNGGRAFRPMADAGAKTHPEKAAYHLALRGKTLVIDIFAPPGERILSFGHLADVDRVVGEYKIPGCYDGWHEDGQFTRSLVPAIEQDGAKLFRHVFADWYRSNASREWRASETYADPCHDRALRYDPRTDGAFNPVSERLFLTVSPNYPDILPTIANPPSPWKHVTGKTAWVTYGSTDRRARDYRHWKRLHRYGIRNLVICDHEICMRDGVESFTFRTNAAPGKGGDAGLKEYADHLIGELGYRYGVYNNFCDLASVNPNFREDRIGRQSDGSFTPAWVRCYSPKPAYAIGASDFFSKALHAKYGFNTAYCDVHTCLLPWGRTDYDARVPGAGTYAQTFYAYGEVLLAQKRNWNGPVYSEGMAQWYYAGLVDGNYGQMVIHAKNDPWIVDFDLLKIHPLECDFGMGNLDMFYANCRTPEEAKNGWAHRPLGTKESSADWFVAAELAFGHSAYFAHEYLWTHECGPGPCYMRKDSRLCLDDGLPVTMNTYFMALPLASRYTQARAREIRYVNATGGLETVSEAIFSGTVRRRQIAVAYDDGTVVVSNGSLAERLKTTFAGRAVDLPPTGYVGWTQDGAVEVVSSDAGGGRHDYAVSPETLYLNSRGRDVAHPRARGNGVAVCRREGADAWELIPVKGRVAFAVPAATAQALGEDGEDLGSARLVRDGAFISVEPVPGAFSYLLRH